MNGWVLSKPDDLSLDFTEVGSAPGTPGDLWGQSDLGMAVVAACGPLQDSVIAAGGGNVLSRWDGAFDGMHILLSVTAQSRTATPTKDESLRSTPRAAARSSTSGSGARDPAVHEQLVGARRPTVWVGAMW
jgi:hypothetical protein